MRQNLKDLGATELEVLRGIWELGPATVRRVLDHLRDQGRDLAYTTVQTLLVRLESKGYVASNKRGMAYTYRSRVSRERVTRSRLRTLLEQLYDGQATPLVLQLIHEQKFTTDEVRQLQEHLEQLELGVERTKGR